MGAMSQLAAEKEQEINILHWEYQEAYQTLLDFQERHPLSHRSIAEMKERVRLELMCSLAKDRYERANERRHTI